MKLQEWIEHRRRLKNRRDAMEPKMEALVEALAAGLSRLGTDPLTGEEIFEVAVSGTTLEARSVIGRELTIELPEDDEKASISDVVTIPPIGPGDSRTFVQTILDFTSDTGTARELVWIPGPDRPVGIDFARFFDGLVSTLLEPPE